MTDLDSTIEPTFVETDEYCSLPTNILDTFETVKFQNTRAIEWMHSVPPRYGKPNDVLLLMAGDQTEQTGKTKMAPSRPVPSCPYRVV
jgi:hypothetical protein